MDAITDSTIGRYRRLFVAGTGSFATVYAAFDDALGLPVALKLLDARHSADGDVRARFVNEARLLRDGSCPHLVRVHDLRETDDGRPYMVLDYADRGTLAERIAHLRGSGWQLSGHELVGFARQVGDGVAAVHRRLGVVHRDLKPSNLLLTTRSTSEPQADSVRGTPTDGLIAGDETLLVADFGLARDLDRSSLTVSAGTLGYMAPEQLQPGRAVSASTDLYALTAIVHDLVVGRSPGALGLADQTSAPAWIRAFLAKGLALDPARRHASAQEWVDDLTGAVGGRQPARLSRRSVVVGAVSAAAAAGIGGAVARSRRGGARAAATGTTAPPTTTVPPATTAPSPAPPSSAVPPVTSVASAAGPAATGVTLVGPRSVAVDATGRVVVADGPQVVIVNPDGSMARIAGTGVKGTGAVGVATSTALSDVTAAVPSATSGEWVFADAGGGVVYRVGVDGLLTVVNRTFNQPSDVVIDRKAGVFVADSADDAVYRVDASGSVAEVFTSRQPVRLALDVDGRLIVSEAVTRQIHLLDGDIDEIIDLGATAIGTLAGVAPFGNGYLVADSTGHRIWRVDATDRATPFAGAGTAGYAGDGGPATDALLDEPLGVAVDSGGRVYVAERGNRAVRVIRPDGTITTLVRG